MASRYLVRIIYRVSILIPQLILCSLLVLTLPSNTNAATTPNFSIEFGKIETVFEWSKDKCAENDIPDFPAKALVDADGNVQLYSSEATTRRSIGPNLTDVTHDCHVVMNSHLNPDPRAYDDFEWLISPYTTDGNTIYGLVHTEYHGYDHNNCSVGNPNPSLNCWWNSINLVKSTDMGHSFNHTSPPTHNIANTSIEYDSNNQVNAHRGFFHPSNIIYKDGYYYATVLGILFPPDTNTKCLMRSNNLEDPNSWRFWNGTDFSLSTKNVSGGAGNCKGVNDTDFDLHWSTYLNKYTAVTGNTIETATTLTSWDSPMKTFTSPHRYTVYATLIQPGAETRNFEDIGRSPWMYFITCGDSELECTKFTNNNRDLKRVRVRFNKPEDVGKHEIIDLKFNEYKGSKTLDSSFYGNDGTITGYAGFRQEGERKYAHFDTGFFTIPDASSLNLNQDVTIKLSLRTTQNPAGFPIIAAKYSDTKRNYGLFLTPEGNLHFSLMNGASLAGSQSISQINDGQWHDIVITYRGDISQTTYIIDGKVDYSTTHQSSLGTGQNSGPLIVGRDFVGDLDHLTISNYILRDLPSPSMPGDLDGDGHVNYVDFNVLISNFGNPYTIFDFNAIVSNYGK